MPILKLRSFGPAVTALQNALQAQGFDPGANDGEFGPATEAAVKAFQTSKNLTADGIAGPDTLHALGLDAAPEPAAPAPIPFDLANITPQFVAGIFPAETPLVNIETHLPHIKDALQNNALADKVLVLVALGAIRAETAGFKPIDEFKSRFNTDEPDGEPFGLYDNLKRLGNGPAPDGVNFKGRGFVQLTGRYNYMRYSQELGLGTQLLEQPELANDPELAAKILAQFLKDQEDAIRVAVANNDLATARKLVNGGSHGLSDFEDTFTRGNALLA